MNTPKLSFGSNKCFFLYSVENQYMNLAFKTFALLFISTFTFGQTTTMEMWRELLDKRELAVYFSGIFDDMGFIIEETGEQFTVSHKGEHFTIKEGVKFDSVDYVVRLKLENIENMQKHGADNKIDEHESFRIMSVLFTPLTEASLTNPTLSKPWLRKMSGIENHIHINLLGPEKADTVSHTLIYLNKKWLVIPGTYGAAKRVFNLSPQEAIDYQRSVFVALKKDSMKEWKKFKKWYIKWREGVSYRVG